MESSASESVNTLPSTHVRRWSQGRMVRNPFAVGGPPQLARKNRLHLLIEGQTVDRRGGAHGDDGRSVEPEGGRSRPAVDDRRAGFAELAAMVTAFEQKYGSEDLAGVPHPPALGCAATPMATRQEAGGLSPSQPSLGGQPAADRRVGSHPGPGVLR